MDDERKTTVKEKTAFIGTSREKFCLYNTLLCLIKSLLNENVTIDLRNDSYVCGTVVIVDGYMNVTLTNAVYCDPQANEFKFETMFIQARNIRYVHIPQSMPILPTLKNELKQGKRKKIDDKVVPKSRKNQKALAQHLKTVALLDK